MPIKSIPSLSTNGWITDVSAKLDYELSCIASTDGLQSNTFSNISSLPSVIQRNKESIQATTREMCEMIRLKLGAVFENVDVEGDYKVIDPTESKVLSKITLVINFTEEGKNYSAARILTFYNGKFKEIAEANNG